MGERLPKIGLALGSGGARGWAHLGVLMRLREWGIVPHCVAGTSIGSIVGALYLTHREREMAGLAAHLDWRSVAKMFFEVGIRRSGLIDGVNLIRFLRDVIPVERFEDLPAPFAVVATDLMGEKEFVFTKGDLFHAIRASISIPGVLTPEMDGSVPLVDGGLVNPLPVRLCREMGAEYVIAVDVNLRGPEWGASVEKVIENREIPSSVQTVLDKISQWMPGLQNTVERISQKWTEPVERRPSFSIFEVLTRSFRLAENRITQSVLEMDPPDLLIQPAVSHLATLEFYRGEEAIQAGVTAANEACDALFALLRPSITFTQGEEFSHG